MDSVSNQADTQAADPMQTPQQRDPSASPRSRSPASIQLHAKLRDRDGVAGCDRRPSIWSRPDRKLVALTVGDPVSGNDRAPGSHSFHGFGHGHTADETQYRPVSVALAKRDRPRHADWRCRQHLPRHIRSVMWECQLPGPSKGRLSEAVHSVVDFRRAMNSRRRGRKKALLKRPIGGSDSR